MKKLLTLACFSLLCAPFSAQSQPWAAVSDAGRLSQDPDGCPRLEGLGVGALASATPTTDNLNAIQAQLLEDLEAQLRQMPKDSPEYKALEAQLRQIRAQSPAAAPTQAPTLAQALTYLRQGLARSAGAGSTAALQKSPEAKNAALAARSAYLGFWQAKPAASLGLLLEAQRLEPKNTAHLVNLSALASYYSFYPEALVLVTAAEKLSGNLEPGVLQANKGHALLLNKRYPEAEKALRAAINANPKLNEPRINLAVARAMQERCKEARDWLARGAWRSANAQALEQETRPLEQKFLTAAPVALPTAIPMVQPTFNGQPFDTFAFMPLNDAALKARRQRLEQLKKVSVIAELRDRWLEQGLVDVVDTASRGVTNNAHIPTTLQTKYRELEQTIGLVSNSPNPSICQNLKAPLEQQQALLWQAYQTSYRAAFAATSRFAEATYHAYAQLRLAALVNTFYLDFLRLRDVAGAAAQVAKMRSESCQTANLPPIVAGAMPPVPPVCTPSAPTAAPKAGFAITVSCDQVTLNQNPPDWLLRFQILSNSSLERSSRNLRLTAFSGGGFGVLIEKNIVDIGGLPTGSTWRYNFDLSRPAQVWFLAAESNGRI
jgi:hypothetical protein